MWIIPETPSFRLGTNVVCLCVGEPNDQTARSHLEMRSVFLGWMMPRFKFLYHQHIWKQVRQDAWHWQMTGLGFKQGLILWLRGSYIFFGQDLRLILHSDKTIIRCGFHIKHHMTASQISLIPRRVVHTLQYFPDNLLQLFPRLLLFFQISLHSFVVLAM